MKKIAMILILLLLLVFSLLTIMEGGTVLLKGPPADQIVLKWLVIYNVIVAALALPVLVLLWRGRPFACKLALSVTAAHGLVLIILIGIYFSTGEVAVKSLGAMSLRFVLWGFCSLVWGAVDDCDRL
ncbi:MAG: hypothetical protein KDK30_08525 [Leptospiraceae bacterium]|nr:hypothetical protein [Leptospiraceae bacterium]